MICLKCIHLKPQPHLPGQNELKLFGFVWFQVRMSKDIIQVIEAMECHVIAIVLVKLPEPSYMKLMVMDNISIVQFKRGLLICVSPPVSDLKLYKLQACMACNFKKLQTHLENSRPHKVLCQKSCCLYIWNFTFFNNVDNPKLEHASWILWVGVGSFSKVVATFNHVGGSFNLLMATTRDV